MAAGGEIAQRQGAEGHALQLAYRVPDRLAHPPDLAVAALMDGDLDPIGGQAPHLGRRR